MKQLLQMQGTSPVRRMKAPRHWRKETEKTHPARRMPQKKMRKMPTLQRNLMQKAEMGRLQMRKRRNIRKKQIPQNRLITAAGMLQKRMRKTERIKKPIRHSARKRLMKGKKRCLRGNCVPRQSRSSRKSSFRLHLRTVSGMTVKQHSGRAKKALSRHFRVRSRKPWMRACAENRRRRRSPLKEAKLPDTTFRTLSTKTKQEDRRRKLKWQKVI